MGMASIGDTVKSIHDGAIGSAPDITGASSIPLKGLRFRRMIQLPGTDRDAVE